MTVLAVGGGPRPTHTRSARTTATVGFSFVVLLLLSAGMASVPTASDRAEVVHDFYAENTAIVVLAQVIGLVAAVAFGFFATGLDSAAARPDRTSRRIGLAVAVAAVLTAIPPLWSCVAVERASNEALHTLAVASDLTDVVLFATIAAFAGSIARSGATWLRVLALLTALVSLAHAVLLVPGPRPLGVVAPLAFIVLVAALSLDALRGGHALSRGRRR